MKRKPFTPSEPVQFAKDLVINNPKVIDIDRHYSHGPGGAKTFIDEERGSITASMTLTNNSASTDVTLAFGNLSRSIYADLSEATAALGFDYMVTDGTIVTVETDKTITGTSNDTDRTIAQLLKYIGENPTRMLRLQLESEATDGADDTSNYAQSLKQTFVSPFVKPIEKNLPLRQFLSGDKFQKRYVDINFAKEGFPVIFSNEHFFILKLKAGTSLNLTWEIGMQDSPAQRLYRQVKKVDSLLAPVRN